MKNYHVLIKGVTGGYYGNYCEPDWLIPTQEASGIEANNPREAIEKLAEVDNYFRNQLPTKVLVVESNGDWVFGPYEVKHTSLVEIRQV